MNEIIKNTLLGLFFGTFGTTIGGILGIVIKKNSNKFLSFILSFASGLMMAVICFDLIPEALGISNIYGIVFGILIGIISMIFCDIIVQKKFNQKQQDARMRNYNAKSAYRAKVVLAYIESGRSKPFLDGRTSSPHSVFAPAIFPKYCSSIFAAIIDDASIE